MWTCTYAKLNCHKPHKPHYGRLIYTRYINLIITV